MKRTSTRGFSLVEFATVLGVMGAVLGAVWVAAGVMTSNAGQQKFSEMLSVIVGNIRGNYAGKAYFESTSTPSWVVLGVEKGMMPILTGMNVFPRESIRNVGGTIVVDTPFGELTNPISAASPYKSLYACGWRATGSTSCNFTAATSAAQVPLFAVEVLLAGGEKCVGATLRNSNPATLPGLVSVYINGVVQVLPLTLAAVPANCRTAGTVNYADFVFRLTP